MGCPQAVPFWYVSEGSLVSYEWSGLGLFGFCLGLFHFGLWFLVSVIGLLEAVARVEIQRQKKVLFKVATLPFL